ncbi:hypothetical protein GYMLUDRAFT_42838 [Collybiopsis luxurians FD-317 M1]|uniref:F-box domain-containing protein n=1 Tax=Collybiopsis luxurians FD-317 M1 TaxID=944289 RepID=A0A0D0BDI2_9AGAR|nr:hypothetical protein GYMLUDRAFT_42838 [Collybiopsis luxurians FD-317 M1]
MATSESFWDTAQSPFNLILGTNYAPSSAEITNIKTFLVEPQRERSRLESEARRIQDLLEASKGYIEAHQALISPIRQLPSEILGEIFVWCLPMDLKYSVRSLKQAPLIFTSICRAWRSIALSTPRLWSSLHIYLPPHLTSDVFSQRKAGISLWLQRSRTLPLSISLHGRTNFAYDLSDSEISESIAKERMATFVRFLMQFSHRIMDLSLSLSIGDFLRLDELLPSNFPILSCLYLRSADDYEGVHGSSNDGPRKISFTSLFNRMPVLRRLQIKDLTTQRISIPTLVVNSLTSIDISQETIAPTGVSVDHAQVLNLLSQMPRLQYVKLMVSLSGEEEEERLSLPIVHLNHLEEMHVTLLSGLRLGPGDEDTQITLFLEKIQCPSLKTLSISSYTEQITKIPFRGFPLSNLETLELYIPLKAETLFECLSLVPNVETLQLRTTRYRSETLFPTAGCLQDSHLVALTLSSGNPTPLCPRLRKFQYIDKMMDDSESLSTAALTDFVESRKDTLECCDVFFAKMPSFMDGELDRLRELKGGGMRIQVHSAKEYPLKSLDRPDVGLVPWWQNRPHVRPGGGLSDMEGPYGTDIIV